MDQSSGNNQYISLTSTVHINKQRGVWFSLNSNMAEERMEKFDEGEIFSTKQSWIVINGRLVKARRSAGNKYNCQAYLVQCAFLNWNY